MSKWIRWSNNATKEEVRAEFPMPETFSYINAKGDKVETTRSDFIASHTFVQEDVQPLPQVNAATIPVVAVKQTPGDPVGRPAPAPGFDAEAFSKAFKGQVDLEPLHAKLDALKERLEALVEAHGKTRGIVEGLAMIPGELHRLGEILGAVHGATVPKT